MPGQQLTIKEMADQSGERGTCWEVFSGAVKKRPCQQPRQQQPRCNFSRQKMKCSISGVNGPQSQRVRVSSISPEYLARLRASGPVSKLQPHLSTTKLRSDSRTIGKQTKVGNNKKKCLFNSLVNQPCK